MKTEPGLISLPCPGCAGRILMRAVLTTRTPALAARSHPTTASSVASAKTRHQGIGTLEVDRG